MQVSGPARQALGDFPLPLNVEAQFHQMMEENFLGKPTFPFGPGQLTHFDCVGLTLFQDARDLGKIFFWHLDGESVPRWAERRGPRVG